jgi:hypothetical protein
MSSHDEILEFLVKKVEETGVGFNITLCMKGLIVTGVLMRSKLYYEEMSKFLDNLGEPSSENQSVIEQWDKYLGEYKQFMNQMKEKSNEKVEVNPKIIHLSGAMIYPSSDVPGSDLPHPIIAKFWRGQLSSVDGFFLGGVAKWNVKEPEDNEEV